MDRLQEVLSGKGSNYILPFFWQRDNDTLPALQEELENIYASGIRAVCVEGRPYKAFAEDAWWNQMGFILKECAARDMKVWLLDDRGFPTGFANDLIPKKYPGYHRWGITEKHIDVTGPAADAAILTKYIKYDESDELIAILACEREENSERLTGRVLDVTDQISGDFLYLSLPAGGWRILFVLKNETRFEWRKTRIDMLSSQSTDVLIEAVYEPHYQHFSEYFGTTFAGFFSDEPCFDNNNQFQIELGTWGMHYPWKDELLSDIGERLGEQALLFLPFLWFESVDDRDFKLRVAYMDSITEQYRENFSNKIGAWCAAHGVEYIGHIVEDNGIHAKTGAGSGHYFRALDGQHMAGIDVVLHQIVPGQTKFPTVAPVCYQHIDNVFMHYGLGKLAASHAAIQQGKKGRAMCEIYGAYGWAEGTKIMKWLTDHMLVRGINYFVPHAFSPKFPDSDCPPHFYARGKNPQFHSFGLLMNYMNRMCHLLNGGKPVVEVAVLYNVESLWTGGAVPFEHVGKVLYDNQIDYHIVPADYLLASEAKNGKLCLNGMEYRCFVIPDGSYLPERVKEKLQELSAAGVAVLFADVAGGGEDLVVSVRMLGIGDLELAQKNEFLRVYHYRTEGKDLYMLFNEDIYHAADVRAKIPVFDGGTYYRYDAFENRLYAKESGEELHLVLEPYEATVLIFGKTGEVACEREKTVAFAEEWNTSYRVSLAKQEEALTFTELGTWEKLVNVTGRDFYPEFSGHIKYETEFPVTDTEIGLDLGYVGESARVLINDILVGERIAPPYRFDISDYVKQGTNRLTVIVSNHLGFERKDDLSQYLLFEPSGLLGPVSMLHYKKGNERSV